MEFLNTTTLWAVFSIIVADLMLAGDNALLIGLACRGLPPAWKRRAVIWGVGGAVVLRIFFTSIVVYLIGVPFLRAAGGLVLGWIALKLLVRKEETVRVDPAETLVGAIRTIIMADLVMSFDNMLAVAGAARGHIELVIFGLLLSLPLLFLGSQAIAWLVERYPVFLYAGAGVLWWPRIPRCIRCWCRGRPSMTLSPWRSRPLSCLQVGTCGGPHNGPTRQRSQAGPTHRDPA